VTAAISCDVLVAANDLGAGKNVALGMVVDIEAAVMVYAASPRGSHFEFTARPGSGRVSTTEAFGEQEELKSRRDPSMVARLSPAPAKLRPKD
jgi:hypothetical protein